MAGIFETTASETHAFLIESGAMKDLGSLGGANTTPYAMNGRGDVVGASETAAGAPDLMARPSTADVGWIGAAGWVGVDASSGQNSGEGGHLDSDGGRHGAGHYVAGAGHHVRRRF